jgi:hypothetical protein
MEHSSLGHSFQGMIILLLERLAHSPRAHFLLCTWFGGNQLMVLETTHGFGMDIDEF